MKKTVFILAAITLVFASANAKDKKNKKDVAPVAPVNVLTNTLDSMSYALGTNVGNGLAKNLKTLPDGKYNQDLFIKGFETALKGDSTLIKTEAVNEFLNKYFQKAKENETQKLKLEGQQFLAANMAKEGVKTTASGLQYQILTPAEGPKPKATDSVTVHYQGFLLDGKKFDSSIDRGQPITFPLNQVIPGWTEGVQLMSVGSKYKFFVPYNLGYGEQGTPNGGPIPGYATLIFEVELLGIKPFVEPAPAAPAKPEAPAKAKTAKSTVKAKSKK
ncbi:MAG: FKBP-type peptidyl-prolyl cis-trans isomerase [Paludibacter sp.]|nr:FKBP-type peptidyl-prolyl cis-trans isomerase [Paludibacter sp.]